MNYFVALNRNQNQKNVEGVLVRVGDYNGYAKTTLALRLFVLVQLEASMIEITLWKKRAAFSIYPAIRSLRNSNQKRIQIQI